MKFPLSLTAALIALTACAVRMEVLPGNTAPVNAAPLNEAQRPGIIRYLNDGPDFLRQRRRNDAYRHMRDACGGNYTIVSESVGKDSDKNTGDVHYVYITFACVR